MSQSISLKYHQTPRRYRVTNADYNPQIRCLFLRLLPVPLPRGYTGGHALHTVKDLPCERAEQIGANLQRLGFTHTTSTNGHHYSRPVL
jgi:hypothetical protein